MRRIDNLLKRVDAIRDSALETALWLHPESGPKVWPRDKPQRRKPTSQDVAPAVANSATATTAPTVSAAPTPATAPVVSAVSSANGQTAETAPRPLLSAGEDDAHNRKAD